MSLRMPAIWSSSERPISVRTVWVDGVRHAILSADDPIVNKKLQVQNQKESERELVFEKMKKTEKRRRPRPVTSINTRKRLVNSCSSRSSSDNSEKNFYHEENCEDEDQGGDNYYDNDLRECLVKLRLVVKNNEKTAESSSSASSPRILSNCENNFGSCHGLLFPRTNQTTRIYDSPYNIKPQKSTGFLKSPCDFNYCQKIKKVLRDDLSSGGGLEVPPKLPEIQHNSLSERVLQWLDISGKVKNYNINKNDHHNTRILGDNFFHRKKITPLFLDSATNQNRNHNHLSRRRSSSAVIKNNNHYNNHEKDERIITQKNYTLNTTATAITTTDLNFQEKGKDSNYSREKAKIREGGDKNSDKRRESFSNSYNNNNNINNNNNNNQKRDETSGSFGIQSYFPIDGTGEISNDRLKIFHNEKEKEEKEVEERSGEEGRQNVWSPPRKPQLHIFMPSLTTNNYYSNSDKIMSSLESVRD